MTLQQMYYITQVARYRSYSEAAKALFVSQSTLSLAIKDAETELHISIFDRSNKGIELTEEGTDFLTRIQDILDRSKNLEEYYLHRQLLGMRFSVSAQRLAFSVRAFNRLLESIDWDCYDVAMRECPTSNVISDVASGKSELGVLASEPHNFRLIQRSLNSNGLVFHELNQLASFVFLRKSHPLAARASVTFTDLREYPFVTYDQEADATYFSEEPVFYQPPVQKHPCNGPVYQDLPDPEQQLLQHRAGPAEQQRRGHAHRHAGNCGHSSGRGAILSAYWLYLPKGAPIDGCGPEVHFLPAGGNRGTGTGIDQEIDAKRPLFQRKSGLKQYGLVLPQMRYFSRKIHIIPFEQVS